MKSVKIVLALFVMISLLHPQDEEWEEDLSSYRQGGAVFTMAETGSGFGGFITWPLLLNMQFGTAMDFLFIRDSKEITVQSLYSYYPVTINKVNNVYLMDLFLIGKKRLFAESMDESFRPFVSAAFGIVYGINHPEDWAKRPEPDGLGKTNQSDLTLGGFLGTGIDIKAGTTYFFSIRVQYRIMPFSTTIGETNNHSMIELRFELGKLF